MCLITVISFSFGLKCFREDLTPVTWRELEILKDSMRMDIIDVVKAAVTDVLQAQLGDQCTIPHTKEVQNTSPRKVKSLPTHRKSDTNQFHVRLIRLFYTQLTTQYCRV
jgi:hypothetical protein